MLLHVKIGNWERCRNIINTPLSWLVNLILIHHIALRLYIIIIARGSKGEKGKKRQEFATPPEIPTVVWRQASLRKEIE